MNEAEKLPPESGRLEMALEGTGTRKTAPGLSKYPLDLKPGSEPQETALPCRLRETQSREKWSQQVLALKLHIRKAEIGRWLKGRFPQRKDWPALVKAGIATEAELQAWRPRRRRDSNAPRPASWFVRRIKVYNLKVVAAALRIALIAAALRLLASELNRGALWGA